MTSVFVFHVARAVVAGGLAVAALSGASAQDALPSAKDIMAQLTADFDQDGIADRLIVTRNPEGGDFGDLHVFKGSKDAAGKDSFKRLSLSKEFSFGVHSIEEKRKGVFTVESGNANGRYKWEQTLTIAWREGRLVVLGITYASYDSLAAEEMGNIGCDLNLSTGKGTRGDKNRPVRVSLKPVPVAQWTDEKRPKVCGA